MRICHVSAFTASADPLKIYLSDNGSESLFVLLCLFYLYKSVGQSNQPPPIQCLWAQSSKHFTCMEMWASIIKHYSPDPKQIPIGWRLFTLHATARKLCNVNPIFGFWQKKLLSEWVLGRYGIKTDIDQFFSIVIKIIKSIVPSQRLSSGLSCQYAIIWYFDKCTISKVVINQSWQQHFKRNYMPFQCVI